MDEGEALIQINQGSDNFEIDSSSLHKTDYIIFMKMILRFRLNL